MVINKLIYNRVFMKGKYLPQITLKRSQSSPQIPENLSQFAIYRGLMRRLSQYRMLLYISIYFLGIFFLFFIKKMSLLLPNLFFDEVSNFRNRIWFNQNQEYVIKNWQWNCTKELNEVFGNYAWILKCVYLHCNWNRINLINVISFPKQQVFSESSQKSKMKCLTKKIQGF